MLHRIPEYTPALLGEMVSVDKIIVNSAFTCHQLASGNSGTSMSPRPASKYLLVHVSLAASGIGIIAQVWLSWCKNMNV